MSSLNESQKRIAETLEGMIVVDAGPGTGKTSTVIARCINIIRQKNFDWHDLVMLTFTRNAAAEMRERLQAELAQMYNDKEIDMREYDRLNGLAKRVTVGTFDSFCLSVVKQAPHVIRKFFRFDEFLTRGANISENESLNKTYFARFLDRFLRDRGDEFGQWSAVVADKPDQVFSLLNRLMARGIVPLRRNESGKCYWFGGDDGKDLEGDPKALREILDNFKGLNNSKYSKFPDATGYNFTAKSYTPAILDEAAFEDRGEMIDLIHEIYYDYIRTSVKDDRLTFGLVACFAFIILYSDDAVRERVGTKYLIVDEFQDTNSNQLMISLLILKAPNLCVVGDWKQGIYGFRYVSIENITDFENKVVTLRRFLNDDKKRIQFQIPETVKIPLTENYRSSQEIIDRAYDTLTVAATKEEEIDPGIEDMITPIEARRTDIGEHTAFELVQCPDRPDELEEVLRRIESYVNSGKYMIAEKDTLRKPEYRDIAVLCRKGSTCRALYDLCEERGIPAFMQGDVEIMNTREGKLLLAWLRYISNDKDPWGITSILADKNYSMEQIAWMRRFDKEEGRDHIPYDIKEFRTTLRAKRRRVTELISDVFAWYDIDNNISQAITAVLSSSHRGSLRTISGLITAIENDMKKKTRYDVDGLPDSNALIIQTMHKSKGLEYPIVIIPEIDKGSFPRHQDDDMFKLGDPMGVRCTMTVIRFGGEEKIGESWRTKVIQASLKIDYSEERRLFFVAISRAKQYVTLIAGPSPSKFFECFTGYGIQEAGEGLVPVRPLPFQEKAPEPEVGKVRTRRKNLTAHDLLHFGITSSGMRPESDADELCHKGMKYGTEVHQMAELVIRGIKVDGEKFETYPELAKVKATKERLLTEGATELYAERRCSLALHDPDVTVTGVIDLLAVFPDRIEVHDWKTDAEGDYQSEYRIQLSIYAHVLMDLYPDRKVTCTIDWLNWSEPETFDPLDIEVIKERARTALGLKKD